MASTASEYAKPSASGSDGSPAPVPVDQDADEDQPAARRSGAGRSSATTAARRWRGCTAPSCPCSGCGSLAAASAERAARTASRTRTSAPPASTRSSSGEAAPNAAAIRPVRRSYSSRPEHVERGDHERPGDQRRDPDGELAVAERTDRQPQRQVVERRVAVAVLQVLNRSCSDRCAWWMLIASSSQIPRGTARRSASPARMITAEDEAGGLEARVRLAASREPPSRAEQLGLVRTAKASEERLQSVRLPPA